MAIGGVANTICDGFSPLQILCDGKMSICDGKCTVAEKLQKIKILLAKLLYNQQNPFMHIKFKALVPTQPQPIKDLFKVWQIYIHLWTNLRK